MNYYHVYFDESEDLGVGRSRSEGTWFAPEVGPVTAWTEPELELTNGAFPDYLASDLGCRLCSERMKQVLESSATRADVVQWLPVQVISRDGVRRYWFLHFPEPVAALGKLTIRQGDFVVKPFLSKARLRGHAVLTYPGGEGVALVVSETVKRALESAALTGFECSPAATEP